MSGLLFVAVDGERQRSVGLRAGTAWMQMVTNRFLKLFGEVYMSIPLTMEHKLRKCQIRADASLYNHDDWEA